MKTCSPPPPHVLKAGRSRRVLSANLPASLPPPSPHPILPDMKHTFRCRVNHKVSTGNMKERAPSTPRSTPRSLAFPG